MPRPDFRTALSPDPWPEVLPPMLIVPGLGGSEPRHWQSAWERGQPDTARVHQEDWLQPRLEPWLKALVEAVRRRPGSLIVAHSLGCLLVAHLASRHPRASVAGALLVAPPDVDEPVSAPACIRGFGPTPDAPMPWPSILAASRTDPYAAFGRSEAMATAWNARLVDLGDLGHVNVAAGVGDWPAGLDLLRRLAGDVEPAWAANLRAGGLDSAGPVRPTPPPGATA